MKTYISSVFIFLLISSTNLIAQEFCAGSKEIFRVTDVMPQCSPDLSTVEQLVNEKFSVSDCGLENSDRILVHFKINCKGEDFDYKVRKFNNKEINCELGDFLKTTLTWTQAKRKTQSVNFSGSLVFKIENSKYVMLSKPKNNLEDKKRKKRRKK